MAYLIVVEGESDCWTLWHHGYPALGIPGSSNVKCLAAEHVLGFDRIVLISEPDVAGQRFPLAVAARLREVGYAGRIETLFMGPSGGYKDPSALYLADPPGFRDAFDALLKEAARSIEAPPTVAGPYEITKAGATDFVRTVKNNQMVRDELANFHARIVGEITKDDGAAAERTLVIRARVGTQSPVEFEVPAVKFDSLGWIKEKLWGAYIAAGQGVRDKFRHAVEMLSPPSQRRRRVVYTHTGWREVAGEWVYLHADGGIGPEGARTDIQADLRGSLNEFRLPAPPEAAELHEALKLSASMVDAGYAGVTLPIFAAIWRAAISTADFSIFLVGKTGTYKTSFAALAQEHFGSTFSRRHLPAGWQSTANQLEEMAFRAKDSLLVIDDFRPATHQADRELQQKAERILRAQGNRAGRGRLWADGSERPVHEPRGTIFSTAEDYVWLASLESRTLLLRIARGQLSQERISALHQAGAAGVFAAAMAGWVHWLAPRLTEVRRRLERRAEEIQQDFQSGFSHIHGRSAEMLGELQATLEIWQEFSGIRLSAFEEVFTAQAETDQAAQEEVHDQATQFVELYSQALSTGKTHAMTFQGGKPHRSEADFGWRLDARGQFFAEGRETTLWIDEEKAEYCLMLDQAHTVVMQMCSDGNRPTGSVRSLQQALVEGGYVSKIGEGNGRQTPKVRRKIRGAWISVLVIDGRKFGLPDLTE